MGTGFGCGSGILDCDDIDDDVFRCDSKLIFIHSEIRLIYANCTFEYL
jgi:hypothetical protein